MFEIEIRDGLLHIGGYVNAVGRDSKPIFSKKRGRCVEQVTPGAFSSSLADGHEVFMKLNHEKVIATTADGSLELREDNIGLKAQATVSDEEVITMAEKGLLKAWSFGFEAIDDDMEERSGQLPRRHLNRIKLNEVSVLSKSPAYEGTLVELRDGDACEPENTDGTVDEPAKEEPAKEEPDETAAKLAEIRTFIALAEAEELIRQGEAEYRAYRDREEAQAFIDAAEAQQWIDEREEEERYNHYHDPTNGQFASGAGGGVGLYYSMGKGKGAIVGESSKLDPHVSLARMNVSDDIKDFSDRELNGYVGYLEGRIETELQSERKIKEMQKDLEDWEKNGEKLKKVEEIAVKNGYKQSAVFFSDAEYDANDRKYKRAFLEVFTADEKARYDELERKYSGRTNQLYSSKEIDTSRYRKAADIYSNKLKETNNEIIRRNNYG